MYYRKNAKLMGIVIILAVSMIALLIASFALSANNGKTYEDKVAAFVDENPTLSKGQIVFLGDSITEGYRLQYYYRNLSLETYNRGISGDTTNWLLSRLQISAFDIAPAKIVLMIGTNDINGGKNAEEIAINYEYILSLIASNLPKTEVLCVSIIPQNTKYSHNAQENNRLIQETNREIERLALSYGYSYINLYDELTDKDGFLKRSYSPDGLHLGAMGYKVWTDVMKEHLE